MLCTVIFANALRVILSNKVNNDIKECMMDNARQITTHIAQNETKGNPIGGLSGYMGKEKYADIRELSTKRAVIFFRRITGCVHI